MPQTSYQGPGSSDSLRYISATNSSESPDPYDSRNHQRHVYSTSPSPNYQPERQNFNITSSESAAAMDSLQRRPSYPERYEYHHQGHVHDHDQPSSSSEPGIHTYGHQRSHSFHGYQSSSSEFHPLGPSHYPYPQQPTLSHVQDPNSSRIQQHVPSSTPLTGRSSRENDYGHEPSYLSRQRSTSTSGNPLSPLQPHSPRSPPNSRSPQTPPLTPSPQKYSQSLSHTPQQLQQRQQQQHHSSQHPQHPQHHPRVAMTTSAYTGKVTHKASGAAVGSNRRLAHILSEQKRREKINGGFDELKSVIPDCSQNTDSKATILRKATAYILALEDELRRYTGPYHQAPTQSGPYQDERDHDQDRE
ncbi:hypothetical protein BGZ51_008066 [Haplosporangium sp. Z 767]|nr:hypothetical protein BGZ51_008066 [Haplosporangium sp. Z 767]KAF9193072.1 hypothetical protein BGZ50_007920 [Haplosporangium sp. Z 11]